jgi:hypothetical protein
VGLIFSLQRTAKHEFILSGSGAIMGALEADELAHDLSVRQFAGRPVHLVADRAACLLAQPLLWRPMGASVAIVLLKAPSKGKVTIKCCVTEGDGDCTKSDLRVGHDENFFPPTQCYSMEVSTSGRKARSVSCRDSSEDLMMAVVASLV